MVVTKEVGRVGFPHVNKPFPLGSKLFKQLMWNTVILVMKMDRYVAAVKDWPVATETLQTPPPISCFISATVKKTRCIYE